MDDTTTAARDVGLDQLARALGDAPGVAIRPAAPEDAVAGVVPRLVVEPADEDGVVAVLAAAHRHGRTIVVRGGGTQLALGAPPRSADVLLDMRRLAGVVEHTPHDMTATFLAGTPLRHVQQTLAPAGQWLALDPYVGDAATVGGIVATNASGPRRLRYGGVRDQIIGIRVVRADGTVAKGGGKVVKNVAGYDLPKLFTGSLGTLGVIVSATFRLYPLAAASRTVLFNAPQLETLGTCALAVNASNLVPSAIDVVGSRGSCILGVRFEATEAAVEDQVRVCVELVTAAGGKVAGHVSGADEEAWWAQQLPPPETPASKTSVVLMKASLLPADVVPWLTQLRDESATSKLTAVWRAHVGHGLVHVRLAGAAGALLQAIQAQRERARHRRGHLVVVDADPELLRELDVWGPIEGLDLMRRVKQQFDPNGILNPGRFVGGI